ncbi:MAG: carbohydrate kinase [Methylococcaceae bacterium]|nr:carbohydrate kinase [Methylococcaceae bacterium]
MPTARMLKNVDVLCVGHASYDLIFSIPHHPKSDEKMSASTFLSCGGGPAANAAVMVSNLGLSAAFSGYLGNDLHGEKHLEELTQHQIYTELIVRDLLPTPVSTVLVKPDGERSLINYKEIKPLAVDSVDFSMIKPKVVLFDGHEPKLSLALLAQIKDEKIPTILDAGSVHEGTLALMDKVDYLICSEKFALQHCQTIEKALDELSKLTPALVITLGDKGLIWKRGAERGSLAAYKVDAVDSTGAGDAFHGAFAAAVVLGLEWQQSLSYASAAGALCSTKVGARTGLPTKEEHYDFWKKSQR